MALEPHLRGNEIAPENKPFTLRGVEIVISLAKTEQVQRDVLLLPVGDEPARDQMVNRSFPARNCLSTYATRSVVGAQGGQGSRRCLSIGSCPFPPVPSPQSLGCSFRFPGGIALAPKSKNSRTYGHALAT